MKDNGLPDTGLPDYRITRLKKKTNLNIEQNKDTTSKIHATEYQHRFSYHTNSIYAQQKINTDSVIIPYTCNRINNHNTNTKYHIRATEYQYRFSYHTIP